MLAHQGGWDEMLLPAFIVALVLVGPMIRRRFARSGELPVWYDPAVCSYCGATVTDEDERCPSCGFRVRRLGLPREG